MKFDSPERSNPNPSPTAKPRRRSLRWHLTEATLPPPELAERVPELAGIEHNPWFVMLMSQHTRTPRRIRPARLIAAVLAIAILLLYPIARFIAHPDYPANHINMEFMPGQEFFGIFLAAFAYGVLGCLWMARVFFSPAPGANPFRRIIRQRPELVRDLYEINSDPDDIARAVVAYHLTMSPRHVWIRRLWIVTIVALPMSAAASFCREITNLDFAFVLPFFLVVYRWRLSGTLESIVVSDITMSRWLPRPWSGVLEQPWSAFRTSVLALIRSGTRIALVPSAIVVFLLCIGFGWRRTDLESVQPAPMVDDPHFWLVLFLIPFTALLAGILRAQREVKGKPWSVLLSTLVLSALLTLLALIVSILTQKDLAPYQVPYVTAKWAFWTLLALLTLMIAWASSAIRARWCLRAESRNWNILSSQYDAYITALMNRLSDSHEGDQANYSPHSSRLIPTMNQMSRVTVWHLPRKAVAFGLIYMAYTVFSASFESPSLMSRVLEFSRRKEFTLWDGINAERYHFMGDAIILPQYNTQMGTPSLLLDVFSPQPSVVTDFLHALHPNYMLDLNINYHPEKKPSDLEILENPRVVQFTEELSFFGMPRKIGLQNVDFEAYRALKVFDLSRTHLDANLSLPDTLRFLTLNECRGEGRLLLHPETPNLTQIQISESHAEVVSQFFTVNQIQCPTVVISGDVTLSGATDLPNLSFFNPTHQIKYLNLDRVRGLLSLSGIEQIQGLQSLKLEPDWSSVDEDGKSKIDISALARCKFLRKIDMSGVYLKNMDDLRLFSEMEHLEKLDIGHETAIDNPAPKEQHTTLEESVLDEARYTENQVRLADRIEKAIREAKKRGPRDFRGIF